MTTSTSKQTELNEQSTSIENKVANILQFTKAYANAAASKNNDTMVKSMLQFAEKFSEAGNFESAFDRIKQANKLHPGHPLIADVESRLIQQYNNFCRRESKDTVQANTYSLSETGAALVLGIENEKQEIRSLLVKAEFCRIQNNLEEARKLIFDAYKLDPLNEKIHFMEQRILKTQSEQCETVDSMLRTAEKAFVDGNPSIALSIIARCYEKDPLNELISLLDTRIHEELKYNFGMIDQIIEKVLHYQRNGEIEKARFELNIIQKTDPLNAAIFALQQLLR